MNCQSYSHRPRSRASTVEERIHDNESELGRIQIYVARKIPPLSAPSLWNKTGKRCALLMRPSHSNSRETFSQSSYINLALNNTIAKNKNLLRQTRTNPSFHVSVVAIYMLDPISYPLLRIHDRSTKIQRALRGPVCACRGSEGFSPLLSPPLLQTLPYPTISFPIPIPLSPDTERGTQTHSLNESLPCFAVSLC